jgi:hypothetical protein
MNSTSTYTVAIRANDPDRYVPDTWKIEATPATLAQRLTALEATENITVTKVVDEKGREIERPVDVLDFVAEHFARVNEVGREALDDMLFTLAEIHALDMTVLAQFAEAQKATHFLYEGQR